jgi:hypothetical protein
MAKKQKVYVNVYLVNQEFGGGEEGGWYYNSGEPIESYGFFSRRKADAKLRLLKTRAALDNEQRPSLWSVRSCGVFEVYTQDHPARFWPERTPHYE